MNITLKKSKWGYEPGDDSVNQLGRAQKQFLIENNYAVIDDESKELGTDSSTDNFNEDATSGGEFGSDTEADSGDRITSKSRKTKSQSEN